MIEYRFSIKWNNGYWKVFDNHLYKDVKRFDLEREAYDYCDANKLP